MRTYGHFMFFILEASIIQNHKTNDFFFFYCIKFGVFSRGCVIQFRQVNQKFEFKQRDVFMNMFKPDFTPNKSPFARYLAEKEKNYKSPCFGQENLQGDDIIDPLDHDLERDNWICKKLIFSPQHEQYKQEQNRQFISPKNNQTQKKAPIFIVLSPGGRQPQFDNTRTEQRVVVSEECSDLACHEDDLISDVEQSTSIPRRKYSERDNKKKFLDYINLKKTVPQQEKVFRRRTNSKKKQHVAPKSIVCNCKKSKCLKLYCDCFAAGGVCGKECNCSNCHNNREHSKEREIIQKQIIERNPQAFRSKVESRSNSEEEIHHKPRHFKGCNCKKSNCLKKYCECYQMGVKCSELCKCDDCKNCDQPPKKDCRKRVKNREDY